jgi:hypothetical protein
MDMDMDMDTHSALSAGSSAERERERERRSAHRGSGCSSGGNALFKTPLKVQFRIIQYNIIH